MDSPGLNQVEFHTGVEEPINFACRLLRKAVRSGARVLVTAPAPLLAKLDRSLGLLKNAIFCPMCVCLVRPPAWLRARRCG